MPETNLKIVTKIFDPFTFECGLKTLLETKQCREPGLDAEILGYLLRRVNVSYTLLQNDEDYGTYSNGTWNGLFTYLANGSYDLLGTSMVITNPRLDTFSITYTVDYLPYAFIVKRFPETFHTSSKVLIEPFTNSVWAAYCVTVNLLLIAGTISKLLFHSRFSLTLIVKQSYQTYWAICRTLIGQAEERPFDISRPSGVILIIMLYMIHLLIVGLYQSALLTHLYVKSPKSPFSTVDELLDLVESGHLKLVTDKTDLSFFEDSDDTSDSVLIRIKSAMDQNMVHYASDNLEALDLVDRYGNYIYPSTLDEATYLLNGTCKFQLIVDNKRTQQLAYLFNRKVPHSIIHKINDVIGESWPMIQHYKDKYYLKAFKDLQKCTTEEEWPSKLSMTNLIGLTPLCISGILASFTALIIELVCFKWEQRRSYEFH